MEADGGELPRLRAIGRGAQCVQTKVPTSAGRRRDGGKERGGREEGEREGGRKGRRGAGREEGAEREGRREEGREGGGGRAKEGGRKVGVMCDNKQLRPWHTQLYILLVYTTLKQ